MTLKSLLDLKFVVERCPLVEYVLKSDDDMIINCRISLTCSFQGNAPTRSRHGSAERRIARIRTGLWKLSKEEFPFDRFPPYESGSAYVISGDVIGELFDTAEYVPPIFIDDVYITGILGRIVGIQHVKAPRVIIESCKRFTEVLPCVQSTVFESETSYYRSAATKKPRKWAAESPGKRRPRRTSFVESNAAARLVFFTTTARLCYACSNTVSLASCPVPYSVFGSSCAPSCTTFELAHARSTSVILYIRI
jgi:hypothetical protein